MRRVMLGGEFPGIAQQVDQNHPDQVGIGFGPHPRRNDHLDPAFRLGLAQFGDHRLGHGRQVHFLAMDVATGHPRQVEDIV
ncbi:MAG: hypothetical protein M0Z80_11565, partial [Treponema sp.]|nr:hypothetical protein [Treponema sp.]